uniref:Uncharacterized protein n=1 Tax=Mycena chlorophos TaxID=658473 RepID=A0ABQ0LYN1_MYCCL|nr:predicted protein [Mycena chlorophos]
MPYFIQTFLIVVIPFLIYNYGPDILARSPYTEPAVPAILWLGEKASQGAAALFSFLFVVALLSLLSLIRDALYPEDEEESELGTMLPVARPLARSEAERGQTPSTAATTESPQLPGSLPSEEPMATDDEHDPEFSVGSRLLRFITLFEDKNLPRGLPLLIASTYCLYVVLDSFNVVSLDKGILENFLAVTAFFFWGWVVLITLALVTLGSSWCFDRRRDAVRGKVPDGKEDSIGLKISAPRGEANSKEEV